jgi:hypothetical protein
MKKISLYFTSYTIIIFSLFSSLAPVTYTNKTFMALPTPHHYLPMKYSCWHRILKQGSSGKTPWGAALHFAPFYRMSNNATGLGKYFGTNNKNVIKVGITSPDSDLRSDLILRKSGYSTVAEMTFRGTIKLSPKHTSYGLYFSYYQELNNITDGLFLQVNLPIQNVENDLRASFTDEVKDAAGGHVRIFYWKTTSNSGSRSTRTT